MAMFTLAFIMCIAMAVILAACGTKGETGANGKDGVSIVCVEKTDSEGLTDTYTITYSDGKTTIFTVTNGKNGIDGENGTDGETPHIGENGNWFIGDTDTGIQAKGQDGSDGNNGEDGQDGITPHIGGNGNWFIGDTDTGIQAKGQNGSNGKDGISITDVDINESGELIISFSEGSSVNLGKVVGADGIDGQDGIDGIGIESARVGENGDLIFTLSNTTEINVGNVKGENGANGKDGVSISGVEINQSGELVISFSDGNKNNLGNILGKDGVGIERIELDEEYNLTIYLTEGEPIKLGCIRGEKGEAGQDGKSAYELYKEQFGYEGTEQEWLIDLVSGRLSRIEMEDIDYIPDLYLTAAVGEDIVLPQTTTVYFADGTTKQYPVVWESTLNTAYIGIKTLYGKINELNIDVTCHIQITNYSSNKKYISGYANGILGEDKVSVTVYNETYLKTLETSQNGYFYFEGLDDGTYFVKIDASGYEPIQPQKVTISSVTANLDSLYNNVAHVYFDLVAYRNPGYYFIWDRTDAGNSETEATVNTTIEVDFLENTEYVSDIGDASYLREKYNVVLIDEELPWSTETSSRFLDLYSRIPESVTKDLKSVWTLTDANLQNDIEFKEENDGVYYVTVSEAAIANMTPRVAVSEGVAGKYFSNRFYNALLRFVTDNGNDAVKCEKILNENFLTSFNVPDYSALTAGITDEDASQFQEFYPEEKLLILTMFEEMPTGMHKMKELKYLVRRKTGQSHPLYPNAAAVTWTLAKQPYIEFMDTAFNGEQGYYDTKRLIIHEKTHMFWEYYFSDELKAQWCEIGGWYKNEDDVDGWSTTKQTEFVSAYAHAKNPDEDMAESVATYVINPNLLRSRSLSKYEFIKDYIMGGSFYLTQIRDDLTFEVYNFNPDYTYPGQINHISVKVEGGLFEDKLATFEIHLQGSEQYQGAEGAYFRLLPGDKNCTQFYDVQLKKVDDTGLILRGTVTMSKYSYSGYWFTDQIKLIDSIGNERYESNADYSLKVYLDNPLYDDESPELVRGSLELLLENANSPEHPDAQYLIVKFNVNENIHLYRAMARLYCKNATKDSIDISVYDYTAGAINQETGEVIVRVYIPEHYSSGLYEISEIALWDIAGNTRFYHVDYGTLVDEANTIEIVTPNPDDTGAVLDVNDIGISAVPSVPEQPNGETFVTLTLKINDDIAGVKIGYVKFLDPQGIIHGYWLYFPNWSDDYFTGDPTEVQTYTFNITLPKGSAPGIWGIYEISLTDHALNKEVYNFTEIIHFEVD